MKSKYNIDNYNFVAHSMGNLSFAYFMKYYGNDKQLPSTSKRSKYSVVHITVF